MTKTESRTVNIHEAKTHFSKLVEEVLSGREIIIAKAGTPVMKCVPLGTASKVRRPLGLHRGTTPLSAEEVAESLRPLDDEELRHWE